MKEGAALPTTTILQQKNLVSLQKRGRLLSSSYEALRFHKLDLFAVTLRQIGAELARELLQDAVTVLVDGDGNSNAAESTPLSAKPTYADMINLWGSVAPYELNTLVASTASMKDLLAISEFQDAAAGLNFQGTGKLATPLGANLIHVPSLEGNTVLGLDKNCASKWCRQATSLPTPISSSTVRWNRRRSARLPGLPRSSRMRSRR